ENAVFGLLWCITIVGIPFGKQFLKIARLALTPFGAKVMLPRDGAGPESV
ncbi:MAG: YccF domain-containing protein, partial [Clostridia bacterium]|nr:YccF domain-containing protein [Clostridia bacterium]